ncbi:PREDICTED: peroxidase-like, partial [Papilio xuthus]
FDKRESKSGRSLPLERFLRTTLVPMGKLSDPTFTTLSTNFLVFMTSDVLSIHDTINYIAWKPYCCLPKGRTDRTCVPNMIPDDDPVHRFSDIRCLNMTRPESFQSIGCIKNYTAPERIITGTPSFDLSTVYGSSLKPLLEKGR